MKLWQIAVAALACVGVAGCRTTKDVLDDYEANLSTGAYDASTREVLELAEKRDDSQLLYRLLAGSALHLCDNRGAAVSQFDQAEEIFARNDGTSVFAQGAQGGLAMMTNDRAFPYEGGGSDRVFCCLYKAIDFMADGKMEGARTELNRVTQRQENWIAERRHDIEAAAEKMQSDAAAYQRQKNVQVQDHSATVNGALANGDFAAQIQQNTGYNPAFSGNLDTLSRADYFNAYASHVTGIFRWLDGDGGTSALKATVGVRPNSPGLARDLADCEKGRPVNQVWIWVEDGLCPTREEWRFDLPLVLMPFVRHYLPYVGMALPVLRERAYGATSWSVVAGGQSSPMGELENVDHLVRTEYDVYMRGALTREITRCVVKASLQVALGVTAENVSDRNTQLALKISQMGVAAWAATTVAADLRSWTSLPKRVMAMRLTRPDDGNIQVVADGQTIPLQLPAGNSMVFVRKTAPSAGPVVKSVTFQ